MSTVTMSLYQALEEKTLLEKKIAKSRNYRLCCIRKENEEVDDKGVPLNDILDKSIRPAYQQSVALLNNMIALKSAINDCNARTMINIAGEEISIANALVRARYVQRQIEMYQSMIDNYNEVQEKIRSRNERDLHPDTVAAYIDRALGTGTKRDTNMVKTMQENYVRDNRVSIYDPLNTYAKAQDALAHLEAFKRELHFKLNQANVNTEITVQYED